MNLATLTRLVQWGNATADSRKGSALLFSDETAGPVYRRVTSTTPAPQAVARRFTTELLIHW